MSQKSEWIGLWNTRPAVYRSKALTKQQIEDLPSKCRIVLRENKFHRANDDGTPRFVFCFADADASETISFKNENYHSEIQQLERVAVALDNAIYQARCLGDDQVDAYDVWRLLTEIREKIDIE